MLGSQPFIKMDSGGELLFITHTLKLLRKPFLEDHFQKEKINLFDVNFSEL